MGKESLKFCQIFPKCCVANACCGREMEREQPRKLWKRRAPVVSDRGLGGATGVTVVPKARPGAQTWRAEMIGQFATQLPS